MAPTSTAEADLLPSNDKMHINEKTGFLSCVSVLTFCEFSVKKYKPCPCAKKIKFLNHFASVATASEALSTLLHMKMNQACRGAFVNPKKLFEGGARSRCGDSCHGSF
ncbi:unnamed protein product, partial [Amoebophrya sp. A120]|eukprot:GSA120T00012170001.1